MPELIQQQTPDYLGNILKGYQLGHFGQQAKANQLQLLAAEQEMDINKQKFAQTQAENILSQTASMGDKNALQRLAGLNPVRAEGIRKQQDYNDVQGARVLEAFDTLPQYARNQKRWEQMHNEYKEATGRELPLSGSFPSERNDPAIAEFNALKTRLKGREQELKEQTDLSVQETGKGLMTFDKKTGEFKPAQVNGQNIPVYVKPPSSVVNVNNGEQPAFRKKLEETYGTKIAERLDKVNNDAENAVQTKQWLGVQREALNNLPNTGVLDSSKIYLGNLANQLGVKVDMGKISSLEQLSAAGNTITIPLVKQLGYNPTDADARLIGSTIANIGKGKATNLQLNDLIDQASDKQIAKAQIADSLRAQGREAELTQELRNYDLKNPIKVRNPQSSQNRNTVVPSAAAIDATARKYGISREQVIAKLKAKGVM
tara:strand:- start:4028 stop:5317 length:1290 start_codon:yes stop_codon:yes gene_type:complete